MKKITITSEEASQRLDKFLRRYLPEAGGSFLYKQLRKKNIVLNGKKASGSELLRDGDVVTLWFSDETVRKFMGLNKAGTGNVQSGNTRTGNAQTGNTRFGNAQSENQQSGILNAGAVTEHKGFSGNALPSDWIIYEDSRLIAVNKPAGVLSQAAAQGDVSVDSMVRDYLLRSGQKTEEDYRRYRPGTVNRLDRNTSGLILAAKTLPAAQELSRMIRDRTVRKYYLALVCGICRKSGEMDAWLIRDRKTNTVRVAAEEEAGASHIRTAFEPMRVLRLCGRPYTLLNVELITGKTHQIRAHLSFIGHPIAGDVKYGLSDANRVLWEHYGLKRQFLHAHRMVFPDPEPGSKPWVPGGALTAPLPEELRTILDAGEDMTDEPS